MTEYRHRVDTLADIEWRRDDVAGLTVVDFRDRCARSLIELPDVHGPDMLISLLNRGIRIVDGLGYGHEITTPETLAKSGGAA